MNARREKNERRERKERMEGWKKERKKEIRRENGKIENKMP